MHAVEVGVKVENLPALLQHTCSSSLETPRISIFLFSSFLFHRPKLCCILLYRFCPS